MLVRVFIALALIVSATQTHANAALIIFGDSLSDTGNLFLASGGTAGPVFSPVPLDPANPAFDPALPFPRFPTPAYSGGTASNGPIWVQQFAAQIGASAPVPSVAGGRNYAWIGATTSGPTFFGVPNLQQQVQLYLADLLISGQTPQGNDTFVVWGGSNDYIIGQTDPNVPVSNIGAIISDLHAAGAERFVVPNLIPLGATPLGQATNPGGLNALTAGHNALLAGQVEALRQTLGVEIIEVDLASSFGAILSDPSAFGLANTTDPALAVIDNPAHPLFGFPAVYPTVVDSSVDQFLFFDQLHPTTVGHGFIAQSTVEAVVPEPSTILVFGGLACCFALASCRRRRARNPN